MKHVIVLFFITSVLPVAAQQGNWRLFAKVRPEATFYSSNYAFRQDAKNTKTTVNTGVAAGVAYKLPRNFFIYAGLGYISVAFHTSVFLNQGALPPPQRSGTLELVTAPDIAYRMLDIPAGAGYTFINKKHFKGFVLAEFCGNYLVNAHYSASEPRYSGTFPKNKWQGYSLSPGVGLQQLVKKNVSLNISAYYSALNHTAGDDFLFSQSGYKTPLTYKFLQFSAGVQVALGKK